MKTINQPYLRAKHPEVAGGRDLVIQVDYPQLVGTVHMFGKTFIAEENRLRLLNGMINPYSFAKANGYRVYITVVCTMRPVTENIPQWQELMHETLQEMALFYANQMTEGMQRQYAD